MKKPPCIRGLKEFKGGCPQRPWNGENGCPAWIEKTLLKKGGTDPIEIKECLDVYMARLHFDANCLLEGNQQATESFRNNMSTTNGPKPDPAMVRLVYAVEDRLGIPNGKFKAIGE